MSDSITLENNVKRSFYAVKSDIFTVRKELEEYKNIVKQVFENQKQLILRIRELESKVTKEKPQEKTIVLTSTKTAKREYIGSSAAKKIHDPVCPFAKNVKPKNKIIFKTKSKAFNMGYKPCDCLKKVR